MIKHPHSGKGGKDRPLSSEQQFARWLTIELSTIAPNELAAPARAYETAFMSEEKTKRRSLFHKENYKQRETMPVPVVREGRTETAHAVKDGLYRLKESGNITAAAYDAARLFEREFMRAGYDRCSTTNLTGAGGGGVSIEDIMARSKTSRDYVYNVLDMLGGDGNPMAAAVCLYIGMGKSFAEIASIKGESKHYWRGVFYCAVRMMEDDYKRMNAGKRRRTRFSGYTS